MSEALNEERQERYLSTLNHNAFLKHNLEMENEYDKQYYSFTQIFGATPYKDGNVWCALIGDNIQVGIVGFGNSPYNAIRDLYDNFHKTE